MQDDSIREMQAAYDRVRHIGFKGEQMIFCEGAETGKISHEDALKAIAYTWNMLGDLLEEVTALSQDHARMNRSLRDIQRLAENAMQGTARSEIPADWWEHID